MRCSSLLEAVTAKSAAAAALSLQLNEYGAVSPKTLFGQSAPYAARIRRGARGGSEIGRGTGEVLGGVSRRSGGSAQERRNPVTVEARILQLDRPAGFGREVEGAGCRGRVSRLEPEREDAVGGSEAHLSALI